jgi:hypothetical protein
MTHCESCDSPPYFQHLLVPTNHPIYKVMLINQVLVDSILRTNYLTLTKTVLLLGREKGFAAEEAEEAVKVETLK